MNSTDEPLPDPPVATLLAPFSELFIEALRRDAETDSWPRSMLLPLKADVLAADRAAHHAQAACDWDALDAAIIARCEADGRLETEFDRIADTALSLLSIAVNRRPDSVANILSALPPSPDMVELADAVADLQAKGVRR